MSTGESGHHEDSVDATAILRQVYNERTGNARIDQITDRLSEVLSDVQEYLGPGEGALYGTAFHYEFAAKVRELYIKDLSVEVSFDNKEEVPYGTERSIRTDVVLRDYSTGKSTVIAIWDIKTGKAELGPSRAQRIRDKAGAERDTPLIQMQVSTGIRNKEIGHVFGRQTQYRELRDPGS